MMRYRDLSKESKKRIRITVFAYLLFFVTLLIGFSASLLNQKMHAEDGWDDYLEDTDEQKQIVENLSKDAVCVTVGTYVENLRELNIQDCYYRVEFIVWFKWTGDVELNPAENMRIYKGLENRKVILDEIHDGDQHYQRVGMDVTVSKNFESMRFPLDSQQMRFYIESTAPVQEVIFVPDYENSGLNRNISISGYEFLRNDIGAVTYTYDSTQGNPKLEESEHNSEIITAFEINRKDFGLYFKCFIALYATIMWMFIMLFICIYHHVDTIGIVPAAIFGTVTNIVVGSNLVPDALEIGLLEYVTIWGIVTIIGNAIAIIHINYVRNYMNSEEISGKEYAKIYGRIMFYLMLIIAVTGQLLLPICAYMF